MSGKSLGKTKLRNSSGQGSVRQFWTDSNGAILILYTIQLYLIGKNTRHWRRFKSIHCWLPYLFIVTDKKYETIILPIFGVPAPFHISTIKVRNATWRTYSATLPAGTSLSLGKWNSQNFWNFLWNSCFIILFQFEKIILCQSSINKYMMT